MLTALLCALLCALITEPAFAKRSPSLGVRVQCSPQAENQVRSTQVYQKNIIVRTTMRHGRQETILTKKHSDIYVDFIEPTKNDNRWYLNLDITYYQSSVDTFSERKFFHYSKDPKKNGAMFSFVVQAHCSAGGMVDTSKFTYQDMYYKLLKVGDITYSLPPWEVSYTKGRPARNPSAVLDNKSIEKSYFYTHLGFQSYEYKQDNTTSGSSSSGNDTNFNGTSVILDMMLRSAIWSPYLTMDIGVRATLLSLANELTDSTIRFVDAYVRAGWGMPFIPEPWRLSLNFAMNYGNSYVTGSGFGYTSLFYPKLYPELRRMFSTGDAISVYFSPAFGRIIGGNAGELGFGLKWIMPAGAKTPFNFGIEYSKLDIDSQTTGNTATNSRFSIVIGLGL